MKTILILAVLLTSPLSFAQTLSARPFGELLEKIQNTRFTYKETGLLFGYMSIQSCLYTSEDIVIFKNYCYPVKNYPARGYTIITRDWGKIDLYEEKLPNVLMRDVSVDEFPVFLTPYLAGHLPEYTLADFSGMIEELYPRYNPGCWSTNFSRYHEVNEADCTVAGEAVEGFSDWARETQSIVLDQKRWFAVMDAIEARLKQ